MKERPSPSSKADAQSRPAAAAAVVGSSFRPVPAGSAGIALLLPRGESAGPRRRLLAMHGGPCSRLASGRPAQAAISITARPFRPAAGRTASMLLPVRGPAPVTVATSRPPQTSWKQATVPSPPSATGMARQLARREHHSESSARAISQISSLLERDPLNESEITTHFLHAPYGLTTFSGLPCKERPHVAHRAVHDPLAAVRWDPQDICGVMMQFLRLQQRVVRADRLRSHHVQTGSGQPCRCSERPPDPAPPPSGRGCC